MTVYTAKDFKVGARVQLHEATDAVLRGRRFATVARVGRRYVYVVFDLGGRTPVRVNPNDLKFTY